MIRRLKRFLVLLTAVVAAGYFIPALVIFIHGLIPWTAHQKEVGVDWLFSIAAIFIPFLIYFFAQFFDWTGHVADRIRLPRRSVPLDELKAKTKRGGRDDFRKVISA